MRNYKPRLLAPIAMCFWTALVVWITYIYVTQPAIRPVASQNLSSAIPMQLQSDLNQASIAWENLQALLQEESRQRMELTTSMMLFPVNTSISKQDGQRPAQNKAFAGGREPVVSMILASGKTRGALIDGVYVTEGQILKNGSTVEHIRDNTVELRDSLGLPRHLALKNPFESEAPDSTGTPATP